MNFASFWSAVKPELIRRCCCIYLALTLLLTLVSSLRVGYFCPHLLCSALLLLCFYLAQQVRPRSVYAAVQLMSVGIVLSFVGTLAYGDSLSCFAFFCVWLMPVDYVHHRNRQLSGEPDGLKKALLTAALPCILIFLIYIFAYFVNYMSGFFVLSMAMTFLWVLYLNTPERHKDKTEHARWCLWLLTFFLFWAYSVTDGGLFCCVNRMCWKRLLTLALPFVCPVVFRRFAGLADTDSSLYRTRVSALFFGFSLLMLLFYILGDYSCQWTADAAFVYLVFPLVVYHREIKAASKKDRGNRRFDILIAVLFVVLGAALIVAMNERLRAILLDIFASATGRPELSDMGWLTYRFAALKCFFCGNTDALIPLEDQLSVFTPDIFEYSNDFGFLLYRAGWWWLLPVFLAITAFAVFLRKRHWSDPILERAKNYLAFSYMLRLVLCTLAALFMVYDKSTEFPFFSHIGGSLDILLLLLLLTYQRRRSAVQSSNL